MERIIIDGLSFSLPLFIMAVGGIYSEKSGITNLALEGFQGMGAFTGALATVIMMNMGIGNATTQFYAAIFFAVLGGALYSLLHAVLCIRMKANQVISGVVLNILAMSLTAYLCKALNKGLFHAASDKFVLSVSDKFTVPGLSAVPVLGAFFKDIYPFEVLIILAAIVCWYILYQTRYGMNLRACGDNPHAVDAAGESVSKTRTIAVMFSGALSGLAGICFAYSISGTLASFLLFGFARSCGYFLVQKMQMPSSYSDLAMTLPYILTLLLLIFFSKFNRAPRALGETYDKGKR